MLEEQNLMSYNICDVDKRREQLLVLHSSDFRMLDLPDAPERVTRCKKQK